MSSLILFSQNFKKKNRNCDYEKKNEILLPNFPQKQLIQQLVLDIRSKSYQLFTIFHLQKHEFAIAFLAFVPRDIYENALRCKEQN